MMNELKLETTDFVVSYRFSPKHKANVLTVRSRAQGRHFAEHARFNLLADDGKIVDNPPIDEKVARFILDHFDRRGDTESFNIFRSDLEAGMLAERAAPTKDPDEIRHQLTTTEHSFTST